jgi:hypothetical protein
VRARGLARGALAVAALAGVLLAGVAACQRPVSPAAEGKPGVSAKVSEDLLALYEAHRAGRQRTGELSLMRVVGDRVLIDAVAAGETAALQAELAALGAMNIAAAGRMVSAELPIAAIPRLESLESLKFVTPVRARGGPPR